MLLQEMSRRMSCLGSAMEIGILEGDMFGYGEEVGGLAADFVTARARGAT